MDSENEILHRSDCVNDRVSAWSTVATWFKGWIPERSVKLSEPNPKQRIAELVISELMWQMKLMEHNRQEREKERRKQISGVDYSWLVTNKPRFPTLADFKRLELEDLCYRLDPEDSTEVIRSMWRACLNEPSPLDLPDMLQNILLSKIQEKRLKQNSTISSSSSGTSLGEWSRWIGNSVLSLFAGQAERSSGFSQQELNKFDSLEMVEMGIEPVNV